MIRHGESDIVSAASPQLKMRLLQLAGLVDRIAVNCNHLEARTDQLKGLRKVIRVNQSHSYPRAGSRFYSLQPIGTAQSRNSPSLRIPFVEHNRNIKRFIGLRFFRFDDERTE